MARAHHQYAQEATLLDYLHEVEHVADRIERLERAIDESVKTAPARMRGVIEALQVLRGIELVSAVTIVAGLGTRQRRRSVGADRRVECGGERIGGTASAREQCRT